MHSKESLSNLSQQDLILLAEKLGVNTKHLVDSRYALINGILTAQSKILKSYASCDYNLRSTYAHQLKYLANTLKEKISPQELMLIKKAKAGKQVNDLIHITLQLEASKLDKAIAHVLVAAQLLMDCPDM